MFTVPVHSQLLIYSSVFTVPVHSQLLIYSSVFTVPIHSHYYCYCNSASTTAPSRSFSGGDVAMGDHRSMMATSSGTAVEVYSVLLVDSINFEGDYSVHVLSLVIDPVIM